MQFSPEQERVLKEVDDWIKNSDDQVFYLFGYAGTGKTTLAKYFAESVAGEVIFAAYTGKAAHVLQTKGCPGACTIHSLIYHSRDKSKKRLEQLEKTFDDLCKDLREAGKTSEEIQDHPKIKTLKRDILEEKDKSQQPMFILNPESRAREASLICIDECSMVDGRMGEDLLSFGTKILVLGDPAQLPPVGGAGYFTENIKPNIMLTEIHRQAAESPIIRMATEVRNQNPLHLGDWGEGCEVYERGTKLSPDQMLNFSQIIVGKNNTRKLTNAKLRNLKGFETDFPEIGDRLVCLRNNQDMGLLNGQIFYVNSLEGIMDRKIFMQVTMEGSLDAIELSAHEHHFTGKEDELGWYEKGEAQEFAFGYALTCHKSQGSQWENVCVFDESYCFRKDKFRWLYTAITRASQRVSIVRM